MTTGTTSIQSDFFNLKIEKIREDYLNHPQSLVEQGQNLALEIFHQAAQRVPAYKDFLKKNSINHELVQTLEDFKKIPIIDKKNYLRAYSLTSLCWDGKLDNLYILSSSSGSTGEPFLWPRGEEQELEGALQFELIFKEFFKSDKLSTLYIICFAMGTWISGPFVLACAENITKKGYPVLTLTPGLDLNVTYSLIKNLAPNFDQIVISGYPPYIKDLLDFSDNFGISWKDIKLKFLFAAEGFSEKWRDYIYRKVGSSNYECDSINLYGSADAAILAHETPVTTTIRKLVSDNKNKMHQIFGEHRLPTLAQYDPRLKFFEEIEGKLIFTTRSGLPLIRYSIGDSGGVYSYQQMQDRLTGMSINLDSYFKSDEMKSLYWKLPFVYVFGRSDFTVSLYGLLIYPEHIKFGLENSSLESFITGKFMMSIEYDQTHNQYLLIRIEAKKSVSANPKLSAMIQKSVITGLKKINTEYDKLLSSVGERAYPQIEVMPFGDVNFFKPGTKQKWVKKS